MLQYCSSFKIKFLGSAIVIVLDKTFKAVQWRSFRESVNDERNKPVVNLRYLFQGMKRNDSSIAFLSSDTMLSSESETHSSGGCPTPPPRSTADKYSEAFAPLRRKSRKDEKAVEGWSGKILHGTHKLGWSDDVLGVSDSMNSSSEDEADMLAAATMRPTADWLRPNDREEKTAATSSVVEEPGWMYGGIKGQSWETSPDRRFVRNFPWRGCFVETKKLRKTSNDIKKKYKKW